MTMIPNPMDLAKVKMIVTLRVAYKFMQLTKVTAPVKNRGINI